MDDIIKLFKANEIELYEYCSLSDLTTFKVGGDARVIIYPDCLEKLKLVIFNAKKKKIKYLVLGNGSNILFSDSGYSGIIISLSKFCCEISVSDEVITCGSAVMLNKLSVFARENSLCGAQFCYGIPATLGGAIYMNAGAYGGEMKDIISTVTYLSDDGDIKTISSSECGFGYRKSAFKGKMDIILSAKIKLTYGNRETIDNEMQEIIGKRRDKQPLNYPSAGSTFKRPPDNFAAKLIDEAGLKGFRIGGAMVSEKHSGFIINFDNATSKDILLLIDHIKGVVCEKTGIMLIPEVIVIEE